MRQLIKMLGVTEHMRSSFLKPRSIFAAETVTIRIYFETLFILPPKVWRRGKWRNATSGDHFGKYLNKIAVLFAADPPKSTGRRRADQRQMLNGIIFRMRSGCQWNHLPKELGSDSTIHRTLQRWVSRSVFVQVWAIDGGV